ncbi:MAG: methyltransferase domain-containing protein [Rickettsiales bacterium]|nr:methyltransferase domain-containing protein [Rickettsiales bacterium]
MQDVLFNRDLLRQNKFRAKKNFFNHNFLHHEVANRIAENVDLLNRNFEKVAEIGAMDDYLCDLVLKRPRPKDGVTNPSSENTTLSSQDGVTNPSSENTTFSPKDAVTNPSSENTTLSSQDGVTNPSSENTTLSSQDGVTNPSSENKTLIPKDRVTNPGLEKPGDDLSPRLHDGVCYDFYPDQENILLEPQSYDLVLSNLNLHFINQIPQFLLQVKNILKPNGVFIASFFGEENLSELAHTLYQTENEIYSGISPRMPPTIDVKTAAALLAKAGFQNPISDLDKIFVEYGSVIDLLKDLKMMGQSNILVNRSRKFFTKYFLNKICQNYQKLYSTNNNKVLATFEIVTIIGKINN